MKKAYLQLLAAALTVTAIGPMSAGAQGTRYLENAAKIAEGISDRQGLEGAHQSAAAVQQALEGAGSQVASEVASRDGKKAMPALTTSAVMGRLARTAAAVKAPEKSCNAEFDWAMFGRRIGGRVGQIVIQLMGSILFSMAMGIPTTIFGFIAYFIVIYAFWTTWAQWTALKGETAGSKVGGVVFGMIGRVIDRIGALVSAIFGRE